MRKEPHVATIARWCLHGVGGVHLEYDKLGGGQLVVSEESLRRFFQRRSEPRKEKAQATRMPTLESIAAEQELIAQGF